MRRRTTRNHRALLSPPIRRPGWCWWGCRVRSREHLHNEIYLRWTSAWSIYSKHPLCHSDTINRSDEQKFTRHPRPRSDLRLRPPRAECVLSLRLSIGYIYILQCVNSRWTRWYGRGVGDVLLLLLWNNKLILIVIYLRFAQKQSCANTKRDYLDNDSNPSRSTLDSDFYY